jgi:lysophospholipase L1-like esterase
MWRFCNGGLPDASVLVIMIGTNDLPAGARGMEPATLSGRIVELLKYVRAKRPKAHVVSLGIASRTSQQASVTAVDAAIKEAVKGMDSKVYFADFATKLAGSDLSDGVHPSVQGWTKILDPLTVFTNALGV